MRSLEYQDMNLQDMEAALLWPAIRYELIPVDAAFRLIDLGVDPDCFCDSLRKDYIAGRIFSS